MFLFILIFILNHVYLHIKALLSIKYENLTLWFADHTNQNAVNFMFIFVFKNFSSSFQTIKYLFNNH